MNDENRLTWVNNNFIAKEFYAPFIIEKDIDYYEDLSQKLKFFYDCAAEAGADEESLGIINKYRKKILEALRSHYRADIAKSNTIILNLLKEIGDDRLAVTTLNDSFAFPGAHDQELQLLDAEQEILQMRMLQRIWFIYLNLLVPNLIIIGSASRAIQVYI